MRFILASCTVPLLSLIFLALIIKTNYLYDKRKTKLFGLAVALNMLLLIASIIDYLITEQGLDSKLWAVRRVTSFINFGFGPFLPISIFKIFHSKHMNKAYFFPAILNFAVSFISIFFNLIFFIEKNNTYMRGPVWYLTPIVTALYIVIFLFVPRRNRSRFEVIERLFIVGILGLIGLGFIYEVFLRLYCMMYGLSTVGIVIYYNIKNIAYFSTDALTGLNNRQMFNYNLDKIAGRKEVIFVELDINKFKNINDTFGHEAGDNALVLFAKVISTYFDKFAEVFRVGGDEFSIISPKGSKTALDKALQDAATELKLHNLTFAFGIGVYEGKGDIHQLLRDVDKKMYENKMALVEYTI